MLNNGHMELRQEQKSYLSTFHIRNAASKR